MSNNIDHRTSIVCALFDEGETMTGYELASRLGMDKQLVYYYLNKLIDEGVVLSSDGGYQLQPYVYEDFDEIMKHYIEFYKIISNDIVYHEDDPEDIAKILANNSYYLIKILEHIEATSVTLDKEE